MRNLLDTLKGLKGIARTESAPQRTCKIAFAVPASLSQESPPDLSRLQLSKREAEQAWTAAYMNICRKEARSLSRCSIAVSRRMQLTDGFMPHVLPVIQRHLQTYARDGGIPDDDRRREILELTIEVIKQLIESYKIAFKQLHGGTTFGIANAGKHKELSAFRVLELTRLQQRVMALRYEVLPGTAWLAVNNIFHAMVIEDRADVQIALLEIEEDAADAPPTQSIRDMYLSVQMMSKFDVLRWPTEWQAFIYGYCKSVNWLAETAADNGAAPARQMSIAYCYDSRPARPERAVSEAELGPAILLDWGKLSRKVAGDFAVFFRDDVKADLSYFQKKLALLPYNECLALVQLQFECISARFPQPALDIGRGTGCDMRIFIGFKSVYQLLHNIHAGKFGVGTRLDDMLAKRSASFAEDAVASVESVWYLQFQDDHVVRLKTQETKFTTGMKIGVMAAYGVGDEGIANPYFGVISRIYRPSPNSVIVDILKHGKYVQPAIVTGDLGAFEREGDKQGNLLGAIVVKSQSGEIKLLLPPVSALRENTQLAMKRNRKLEQLTLGKKQVVTKDFFLFRLAAAPAESVAG